MARLSRLQSCTARYTKSEKKARVPQPFSDELIHASCIDDITNQKSLDISLYFRFSLLRCRREKTPDIVTKSTVSQIVYNDATIVFISSFYRAFPSET